MKTFQKITLAAAISAAPFASQAMEALDDSVLAATTGQAGVTIEINIQDAISIGEIEYTDTAHDDGTGTMVDGGSVSLQNIRISNVNNLTQTIDVTEDGDLAIGMSDITGIQIALGGNTVDGNGDTVNHSAVALRSANGAETELVNNLDMTLNVGAHTTYIRNLQGRSGADMDTLGIPTAAQGGSVAIQSVAKLQITDMNVGAFGYTADQAGTQVTNLKTALAGGTAEEKAGALALYNQAVVGAGGTAYADLAAYDAATAPEKATSDAQATGAIANGAAVKITGVQFYDTVDVNGTETKTHATIDQTIWAKGGSSALGGGVYIQIGEINGTLEVGGIELGGSSIGSLKVSDLNLAGMTQRIYGH